MNYVEPTKGWIRSVDISGTSFLDYAMGVKVWESVCKPYRTGQVVIRDNDGLIEQMKIVGGEPVHLAFSALPNPDVYDATMNILALQGHADPDNLKSIIYNIDLIDQSYFHDRSQLVQSGHVQQTVTDAIQQVWGKYLSSDSLKILSPAINRFEEAFNITNKKPFTAIYDLMKNLSGGSYKNGNGMLYKDRYTVNLASLEDLFSQMGSQTTFIQKETWGKNFFDNDIYQAIIYAEAKNNRNNAGRSSIGEVAATIQQGKQVFDYATANIVFQAASALANPIGGIGSMIGSFIGQSVGQLGGSPNVQITNSKQQPDSNAPYRKTAEERNFGASARGGPQQEVQVPLQSGIGVTVGKGVTLQLLPSAADMVNVFRNSVSGQYLVTDLCHALEGDNQQARGTTTMQCLKPGFSL